MDHEHGARIIFKDSTLREGLDVPGVSIDLEGRRKLLVKLAELGVPEAEIVAPGHFDRDLEMAGRMGVAQLPLRCSGLIYGNRPEFRSQLEKTRGVLHRVDILMPLVALRPPAGMGEKTALLRETLRAARDQLPEVGAGFPHALQVEPAVVLEMSREAVTAGATRITLYDTNGAADPWQVVELVGAVRGAVEAEICFHAHNDLGMATANSLAAVRAGATCLDVTVNGLGDRAGNASLEQVALALQNRGEKHGLRLELLRGICAWVAEITGVPVPKLAPVVGEFVAAHKSPSHLNVPELFEAFDPGLLGIERTICND